MAPAERFEATGDPTPGPSGDQDSDDSETPAEEMEADDGSDASDNDSSSDSDDNEAGGDDGDNGSEDVLANAYKEKPKAPSVLRPPGAPTDLQFRPSANEIAVGTIDGDIVLYSFTDESAELKRTYEVHEDATRRVCFSEDGRMLFSISKNGDLAAVDVETGEIEDLIEEIYEDGAHALQPVNRHVCVTGDADGFLKVFDFRSGKCVMEQQVHSDLITSIVVFPDQKTVVASSADGTISSYNVKAKRFEVQSEEYKEDMTAMALTRSATKLLVTTNKGMMYVFDHGAYGLHSATFGRPMKSGINALVAVGDKMVIAGNEDGVLRAVHVFPNRILGVVGQHEDAIDRIDVSSDGDFLASTDNEVVRFWNVSYLKSVKISDKEKGDNKAALSKNLPSSRLQDARNFFADMDE